MKWSNEQVIKALKVYKNYPILWNGRLAGNNSGLKEVNMNNFADDMKAEGLLGEMTIKQLSSKMKNVKDVFRQEIAKVARSKKKIDTTDPTQLVYIPKLAWFQTASYLEGAITTRESNPNLQKIISNESLAEKRKRYRFVKKQRLKESESKKTEKVKILSITTIKPPEIKEEPVEPNENINSDLVGPIGPSNVDEYMLSSNNSDVFEQFGKYIACELRGLPPREAILLQQEIQNSITEVKLLLCSNKSDPLA